MCWKTMGLPQGHHCGEFPFQHLELCGIWKLLRRSLAAIVRVSAAPHRDFVAPRPQERSRGWKGGSSKPLGHRPSSEWFFEWPGGKHPLNSTWPWTNVKLSVVVLWGVCWMFRPMRKSGCPFCESDEAHFGEPRPSSTPITPHYRTELDQRSGTKALRSFIFHFDRLMLLRMLFW